MAKALVNMIDSPLGKRDPAMRPATPLTGPSPDADEAAADAAGGAEPPAGDPPKRSKPAKAAKPRERAGADVQREQVRELAAPQLGERERRLAVDIPETIVDSFSQMVEQLRVDGGRRASQKALSNREVLAALLHATLGDPTDPRAVERMRGRLQRYRATQLEQAAKAAREAL